MSPPASAPGTHPVPLRSPDQPHLEGKVRTADRNGATAGLEVVADLLHAKDALRVAPGHDRVKVFGTIGKGAIGAKRLVTATDTVLPRCLDSTSRPRPSTAPR